MDSDIMRSVSARVPAAGAQALWSEAVSASHRPILHPPLPPPTPPPHPTPRPTLPRPLRPHRRTRQRTSHSSPSPRARGEAIPISCWFLVPRRRTRRSGYSGLATTPSMSPCDPGTAVHSFVFNASDPALVSRHGSDVVGCAQPSERSARRIAQPIPSVLASDATPRCASMASADRQMIGDATLGMKRQHQGNPCCLRTNGPERPAPQGKHAASGPRQSPSLLARYLRHPSKMTENFHIRHIFVNIFTSHAPFQGASPTPCAPTSTPRAPRGPSALRRRCHG